jgi:hypothetical protein
MTPGNWSSRHPLSSNCSGSSDPTEAYRRGLCRPPAISTSEQDVSARRYLPWVESASFSRTTSRQACISISSPFK